MRCITCENISFSMICKTCQNDFLNTSLHKRELEDNMIVYSFYKYDEIQDLLNAKYYFYGDRILNVLAKLSFKKFSSNFSINENIYIIPIDDIIKDDMFSHTAILVKHLKQKNLIPQYNCLKAQNKIKFAGKSLEYRKKNKRNFVYNGKQNIKVILVDDIVTTGLTILEAKEVLEKNNCEVLFALTLSDAKLC